MKSFLLCCILFYKAFGLVAQVGVNTVVPNAQFEVKSSNELTPSIKDGILIPKVNAFTSVNPTVNQHGMLVFLTANYGAYTPGFYYWDNLTLSWVKLSTTNTVATDWSVVGNGGIASSSNFIGTTDDTDLVFKRDNVFSGALNDFNTSFGNSCFNTTTSGIYNSVFGINSLQLNTSGTFNSAFGMNALGSNTTGSVNSSFGGNSLSVNSTGNDNSAFGGNALFVNTIGNRNAAFGIASLQGNTTGDNNAAFGNSALSSNITGTRNTSVGYLSDVFGSGLSNATAIGANALVGANDSLVLGSVAGVNGALNSVNVGIGTTTPQTALEIFDDNTNTTSLNPGNLNVSTTNAQAIDVGGSITLGGYTNNSSTNLRTFATLEGRKSNGTNANASGYLMIKTNDSGTLTERVRVTNLGRVGIGTSTPGGQLELSLNEGRKPGTTTWTIVSDARLKTINGPYTKGLREIMQLQPVRFNYCNKDERKFDPKVLATEFEGFIAQAVQPIFPEAVATDADGFLSFNMHPVLIAFVNAIKELNQKNALLQLENEVLKKQLHQQDETLQLLLKRVDLLEKK